MPKIAADARKAQPGLIVVDRTVHGQYENYQTPEQKIPETQLDYPWESCMTLGGAWGFVANDRYKPAREVVHKLVEIVAKGGSLLLGIGPKADGTLPDNVIARLGEVGQWTAKNGGAIYGTRITKNYHDGQNWFTQSKDGKTVYGISLLDSNPVKEISWTGSVPKKGTAITLLSNNQKIKWKLVDGKVHFDFPKTDEKIALAFSFIPEN